MSRMRHAACLLLAVFAAACGTRSTARTDGGPGATANAGAAIDTVTSLIEHLRDGRGRYVHLPSQAWNLEGMDTAIRAFVPFRDTAVVRLVNCLDRADSTATTVEGRPVPLGVLCYEALTYLVNTEPDFTGDWPGDLFPTAGPAELSAAKAAWLVAVREHHYRFN
jgi:hypothetical protein